ncbi:hypothetical protein EV137_1812 [Kribbella pratensis]|uniref:ClpX-type ZB domain-containing protein n=1 Tax=Kribbella pratensis TaxID=2512112 RepID=A0ABY2FNZ8_9ACTN|nr:hypothetical protein [Kribbella pratensis]TDW94499.1 hypothetical protein EV137_1812 [Kribbella pratensis]
MTVAPESVQQSTPVCWCCAREFDDRDLVRLGAHPEVGVCLGCARFLQRRAEEREDQLHPSRGTRLRGMVRSARKWVIGHRWHELPVIGGLLRRIDRRLP